MTKLLVLDTETTGLEDPIEVVEVAWLEMDEDLGIVLDSEFSQIVNPGGAINCSAAGIHGIRDEDITEELPVLSDLAWPTGDILLVGHNISFDRPLVEEYLTIVDDLCTMRLARRLLPNAPDHKLSTLGCYCDLPRQIAHRAMGDVLTTAYLLDYLVEGAGVSLSELIDYAKQPVIFSIMPWGKWKGDRVEDVPWGYWKWLNGLDDLDPDMRATVDKYF